MTNNTMRELTEKELQQVSGGALSTQTKSGNPTNGKGEGLVTVNPAGHQPPGAQP